MKYFLLIFLFINSWAVEIDYSDVKYEDFTIHYLQDKQNSFKIDDVKSKKFENISNTNAFSNSNTVWYKIEVTNTSTLDKKIFLHNNFAYFSKEIYIYEVSETKLIDQNMYNILDEGSSNKLVGSTLIYESLIPANKSTTFYIKNRAVATNIFSLNIYDKKTSLQSLSNKTFYSNIIIFILLTLGLYNAMLYFYNRRKEYIFYSFYLLNATLGFLYMYGSIFNNFHIYGENVYWLNLTAILVSLLLALFLKQTFNTAVINKKVDALLNSLIYAVILNILIALSIDLMFAMELLKVLFLYSFGVMIYLGIFLVKSQNPLAKLFITAYSIYILGMTITLLAMSNLIAFNSFTFHASGIGLVLEAILFSYLINNQVKILEGHIRDQREIIITNNKKAQLGDMISAITHQWKQPLSRVTSSTSLLEFKLTNNIEIKTDELSKKITQINTDILFLSNTIDDFKDFFNPNRVKEDCYIKDIINKAIELSKDDTLAKEIMINTDIHLTKKVNIYQNELLHILLNILQNSKEAFKESSQEIKIIKLIGYIKDEHTYIDIIDNAGGISEKNIPFIFNEHYTTKENKSGSGIGLYLSKVILENHLKGTIEVSNTQDGAMFRIII